MLYTDSICWQPKRQTLQPKVFGPCLWHISSCPWSSFRRPSPWVTWNMGGSHVGNGVFWWMNEKMKGFDWLVWLMDANTVNLKEMWNLTIKRRSKENNLFNQMVLFFAFPFIFHFMRCMRCIHSLGHKKRRIFDVFLLTCPFQWGLEMSFPLNGTGLRLRRGWEAWVQVECHMPC